MSGQLVIVVLVVLAALAYVVYRIRLVLRGRDAACNDCSARIAPPASRSRRVLPRLPTR